MNECPVCGIESLTFYPADGRNPDMIICVQYENDKIDASCGARFRLDRNIVRKSWMRKLVNSSCKGDAEYPCQELQCPSCEALEDDDLIFSAEARDQHPDVDRTCEHDE